MTSAKTLSASIRSSVIGHHLPSSGRPCPARKVPPGTRLLSHSGANAGQQPIPLSINPAGLEPGGVFLCRPARRQNGGRVYTPKVLALGAKPRRGARLGRARMRRPGSATVPVVPTPASAAWMRGAVFRAPRMEQGAQRRAAVEPAKGFHGGEARRRRPCFANAKYYGTNTFHRKALDTPSKWEGRVS